MNAHEPNDRDALPPELLSAYADGELAPAECRRVEDWLAAHPEARADVEAQRRLARLFDESAPPAPADERWAEALARVESGLGTPPSRRRWVAVVAVALAAAAALLLTLALKYPRGGHVEPGPSPSPSPAEEEVLSVASPDDVEIVSMDDRDRDAVVVGDPPVNKPMELLTEDEVVVNKMPEVPGRVSRLHVQSGSGVWLSVDQESDDDP